MFLMHFNNFPVEQELSSKCSLPNEVLEELQWWSEDLSSFNGKPILKNNPDVTIYSDTSLSGWKDFVPFIFPPFAVISKWLTKIKRKWNSSLYFSFLAKSSLVSNDSRDINGNTEAAELVTGSTIEHPERVTSVDERKIGPTCRLEMVRQRIRREIFSEQTIELLLQEGNRPNTSFAYQSAWNSWQNWCSRFDKDPFYSDLTNILEYLSHLHSRQLAYNTNNVHRSMLSSTLAPIDNIAVGKHPLYFAFNS